MENVKYNGYPFHVWHVPICYTNPGTLFWTTPNNRDINLVLTAHTGMC